MSVLQQFKRYFSSEIMPFMAMYLCFIQKHQLYPCHFSDDTSKNLVFYMILTCS